MKPLSVATALGLTLVASACGLSLAIEESSISSSDAATPLDVRAPDAATPPSPCTTLLAESFSSDEGDLDTLGRDPRAEGDRLTLVRRDEQGGRGAAYFVAASPLSDFEVAFTVHTGALGPRGSRADGLAVSWLELPIDDQAEIQAGRGLGMTDDPRGQRGHGVVLDVYDSPRAFAENEIRENNVRNDLGTLAEVTTDGELAVDVRIRRSRGSYVTTLTSRNGPVLLESGSPTTTVTRTTTDTDPSRTYRTFLFSASSGRVQAPGFYVDDVTIATCPR
ncbi:MAG: hypothetical protein U0183_33645 [Polyangiaceae bacterium]